MAQHVKVVTANSAAKKYALMVGIRGAPRRQLIIHHVSRFVQFLAWFFKTKLDNMSKCAALYHSLAEERIGHGKGRNSILLFQKQGMASTSDTLNSCSASHPECDGNTQFQGFLLEQTVNSEFRGVLTLLTSYAAGGQWLQWCFSLACSRLGGLPDAPVLSAGVSCCLLGSHVICWGFMAVPVSQHKGKSHLQAWNLPLEHSHCQQCTFSCYKICRCEKMTPEIDSYCIFYLVICKVTACCLLPHQKYIFHDVEVIVVHQWQLCFTRVTRPVMSVGIMGGHSF